MRTYCESRSTARPASSAGSMKAVIAAAVIVATAPGCLDAEPSLATATKHLATAERAVLSIVAATLRVEASVESCPDSTGPEATVSVAAGDWSPANVLALLRDRGWTPDPPLNDLGGAHRRFGDWTARVQINATSLVIYVDGYIC